MNETYAEKLLRDLWRLRVQKAKATGSEFDRFQEMENDKWLEVCSYLTERASPSAEVRRD